MEFLYIWDFTNDIARRQYAESWRKMQELRAQIQAQLKLADTLKKISEAAGKITLSPLKLSIAHELKALQLALILTASTTFQEWMILLSTWVKVTDLSS